ncbi:MAG: cation-translocating P-type ATPase [Chlamydiae bacterium]|nr:cation-translocating P-type ATPase [Chlamydiota bacterium]
MDRDIQPWNLSIDEICSQWKTDSKFGLDQIEVNSRLQQYGLNKLPEKKKISIAKIFARQFSSLIVWLLIVAAFVAGFLGETIDAWAIGAIILLNAALGFIQEFRAEKSLEALKKLSSPTAKVIREGNLQVIPAEKVVLGDLLLIEAGDNIPADGRVVYAAQFYTNEASLTGESLPVEKTTNVLESKRISLGDKVNMAFRGTIAVNGKGYVIVTATAIQTEIGKIAALLEKEEKKEPTPLQRQLSILGKRLVFICIGIVGIVFFFGLFKDYSLITLFLTAISLAVAAIPEGLPAAVTIALSVGVRKMAKRQALIRMLSSVETLGCTTVICTDKTGTLTLNEMSAKKIWIDGAMIDVESEDLSVAKELLKVALLCNNAQLYIKEGKVTLIGDPTEGALLKAAHLINVKKEDLEHDYPLIEEFPFDSDRKMMSMVRKARTYLNKISNEISGDFEADSLNFSEDSIGKTRAEKKFRESDQKNRNIEGNFIEIGSQEGRILFAKGAPDVVITHSSSIWHQGKREVLTKEKRRMVLEANEKLASQGLRVLALAYKTLEKKEEPAERDLVFVGLIALRDPPRKEAKEAIEKCKRAGIRPVMVTGDHKETALAIGRELNMIRESEKAITGAELDEMDEGTLIEKAKEVNIFARISAEHKIRIVYAFQKLGHITAMTGDGVNDAPAIREADIGIAMGITGTDVAKQTSDMVILDDNFASIVSAVEEGRGIYDNIVKFVSYLLSSNFAEILVIFASMLLGFSGPDGKPFVALLPVQLLWINLITDGAPAISLALDPIDPRAMDRPPRKMEERILSKKRFFFLLTIGIFVGIGALTTCYIGLSTSVAMAQTMAFTSLVVLELVRAQMVRKEYKLSFFSNFWLLSALASSLLLQLLVLYIPSLRIVFGTVFLGMKEWMVIFATTATVWILSRIATHFFAVKGSK